LAESAAARRRAARRRGRALDRRSARDAVAREPSREAMSGGGRLLRVLTWNVHGCVGRDGVRDPDRVAAVLEAAEPDIAALQEIDSRSARAGADDLFAWFERRFGWRSVAVRTISAKEGHYGHIVLSRWPLESLGEMDLTVPGR